MATDVPAVPAPDPSAVEAYNAKVEAKRERYADLSARKEAESTARFEAVRRVGDMIPLGQPILAGHHSEKRHRRDLERMDNNMRKSVEAGKAAAHYADKAENYGKHGISSDDPAAVVKLKAELEHLEAHHARLKATAKAMRAAEPTTALLALGYNAEQAERIMRPNYMGKPGGVESWQLSNNNANMRRIRQRIELLAKTAAQPVAEPRVVAGVEVVEDAEANRLRLVFPGKPSETIRAELKRWGFRWSPTAGAWQRQRGSNATYAAERVLAAVQAAEAAQAGGLASPSGLKPGDACTVALNRGPVPAVFIGFEPWQSDGYTHRIRTESSPDGFTVKGSDLSGGA